MPSKTNIEWTEATWNPVTGCSKVSQGCLHCYAETLSLKRGWSKKPWAARFAAENVVLHPERLEAPLRWRKPRMVFVNSMSDLFHENVPDEFIDRVFAVMALTPQHTYQILTKRPERMREYMTNRAQGVTENGAKRLLRNKAGSDAPVLVGKVLRWPMPHLWLGVSVENQRWADERIPRLLDTPAAVRFLSCEPLLGPLRLRLGICDRHVAMGRPIYASYCFDCKREPKPDWIIVGGESGPRARPMKVEWAQSIVDQCKAAGVPAFVKQLGGRYPGGRLEDLPEGLRVREWPEVAG